MTLLRAGRAAGLAIVLLGLPATGQAQRFAVDVEPFGGSASIAFARSTASALGIGLGVTLPELSWTIAPEGEKYEELAHLAAFYRGTAGPFETDIGLRMAAGDALACDASDCWPGFFAGIYTAFFAGWSHVRFGTRVVFGSFAESNAKRKTVVNISPILVRVAFGR